MSHDRYFINRTATRILDLTHNTLVNYIGNYDYYLEKRDTMEQLLTGSAGNGAAKMQVLLPDRRMPAVCLFREAPKHGGRFRILHRRRSRQCRLPAMGRRCKSSSTSFLCGKDRLETAEGRAGPPSQTPERAEKDRGCHPRAGNQGRTDPCPPLREGDVFSDVASSWN